MGYEYLDNNGVIVPDTADILAQVQQEFRDVFGQDLIVTPNTPQGLLITEIVIERESLVRNNAQIANQINPQIAGGIFLDAIGALTGDFRLLSIFSTVLIAMTGVPNSMIPAGIIVTNSSASVFFVTNSSVLLDNTGIGSVLSTCTVAGDVAALAGTLTVISEGSIGLETVNNPSDAVLGSDTESDLNFKNQRRVTLAMQGTSLAESITSGLNSLPGVVSPVIFRENKKNISQVIDGTLLLPHSTYVCVDGGTDADIAETLTYRKGGGSDYNNGNGVPVSYPYTNAFSGQVIDVLFDRPIYIPILVRATVGISTAIENPVDAVKKAILDYANNNIEGETGLVVGQSVSCFELSGAVNREAPQLYVQNMEVSLISPINFSNNPIQIAIWERATISSTSITVIVLP
jgi:hypothetical protein